MSDLVGNPEDRFSHSEAPIIDNCPTKISGREKMALEKKFMTNLNNRAVAGPRNQTP